VVVVRVCCQITEILLMFTYAGCLLNRFLLVSDTVEALRVTYYKSYIDLSAVVDWEQVCTYSFYTFTVKWTL
jgi:hypothetical protein